MFATYLLNFQVVSVWEHAAQWRPYRSGGARGPTDLGGPPLRHVKKIWSIIVDLTKRRLGPTKATNTEMNKLYKQTIIIKLISIYCITIITYSIIASHVALCRVKAPLDLM